MLPPRLIEELAKGKCVAFVGAGFSMGAGLPGWRNLLQDMLVYAGREGVRLGDREAIQSSIEAGDLLPAADELRERLGRDRFQRFMTSRFRSAELRPTNAHLALTDIPLSGIITTNYDKLIETAYTLRRGISPPTFTHEKYPEMAATLRDGGFYILKMHGCVDDIQSLILGTSDYKRLMQTNSALATFLTSVFLNRTILFLGYSLNDPGLVSLLDHLKGSYFEYSPRTYALAPEGALSSLRSRRIAADHGIEVITYRPSTPNHPELNLLLQQIADGANTLKCDSGRENPFTPAGSLAQDIRDWLQIGRAHV